MPGTIRALRTRLQAGKLLRGRTTNGECGRFRFAQGLVEADRTALLTHMAIVYDYRSYLEIGVRRTADNFLKVPIEDRVGVDPDPAAGADFVMPSDEYFAICERSFDLIFIDGLHEGDQVARDIEGALRVLNPGGAILLHDLNPPTAYHGREVFEVDGRYPVWCGTSWRGFVHHRATRDDLEMYVVDTDWGVGVVRRGRQRLYSGPYASYADLERDRARMLNLITVRDFLRRNPASPLSHSPLDRPMSRILG